MASRRSGPLLVVTAGLLVLMTIGALAFAGWSEEAVRSVVRSTAKLAVVLFSAAFSASSLQGLFAGIGPAWLLANRRPLGLAFAMSHSLHLLALLTLGLAFPEPFVSGLNAVTLIGGGIAYGFMFAMAATSTDAAVRRMGRKHWARLHTVGGWYIWLIFLQSYLPRAIADPLYVPFAALLLAVLGLRTSRALIAARSPAAARRTAARG